MRMTRKRLTHVSLSKKDGVLQHGLVRDGDGGHVDCGERGRRRGRCGKTNVSNKSDFVEEEAGDKPSCDDQKAPKYWRRGTQDISNLSAYEVFGGIGDGVDLCPAVTQVAKQEAALAINNADHEQDESVTTLVFAADQRTNKSEASLREVQSLSQHARNEVWVSDCRAYIHMIFSCTGMMNCWECQRTMQVADDKSLTAQVAR